MLRSAVNRRGAVGGKLYPDDIDETIITRIIIAASLEAPLMPDAAAKLATAFDGARRLASGPLIDVAMAVKAANAAGAEGPLLAFDDATGAVIDLDLRGSRAEVAARLAAAAGEPPAPPRGRGRPKLGVVAREVTLLPRHWEWLATQPGGASVALRRLVDAARRSDGGATEAKQAKAAAFRFLSATAGDLPGFEEALRALFAGDRATFGARAARWPPDVRDYATQLAFASHEEAI